MGQMIMRERVSCSWRKHDRLTAVTQGSKVGLCAALAGPQSWRCSWLCYGAGLSIDHTIQE